MVASRRYQFLGSVFISVVLALPGCSSGGGAGGPPISSAPAPTPTPTPAPTPAPTPTPTPAPTPTPTTSYDTSEYRATVGAVSLNALAAYNQGATGLGVKVGVIDSGIDLNSQEFTGRIDAASTYLAGTGTIQDEGGHGTAVAFTLAGRRNGVATQGVAFDATLIVLRTDTAGSCAGTDGCQHNDSNIAAALDVARTNGARVVNISLGGSPASQQLASAINRATAAGVIIVISAGNDGTPQPDPLAQIAENDPIARNLVIIAGSIGTGDQLSSFSDQAGSGAAHYLAAVGEGVRAPDNQGTPFLWSGTSFSAPQISGAIALLAQAFPNLTGAQIIDILFQSARDAGAPGTDPIYGRGILDLTRAFQPLGSSSLAGTRQPVSLGVNGTLSAPMGDAAQKGLGAVILDGYGRAFAIDLANTLRINSPTPRLASALAGNRRTLTGLVNGASVAVTIAPDGEATRIARLQLTPGDAQQARTIAATVSARLGARAQFAIGIAQGAASLGAGLQGRADPAFLIANDPTIDAGFASTSATAFALRRTFGRWGLTASVENGHVLAPEDNRLTIGNLNFDRYRYERVALAADRRFGPLALAMTATSLIEHDTVLGAHFGQGLGGARATSWFLDTSARIEPGDGWTLGGSLRRGWTLASVRAGLNGSGLIRTEAFAADIGKTGVFGARDRWGLRIAQPLRVSRGGIDIDLPTNYDYATLSVDAFTRQRLNLAPTGRELDFELGYARTIGRGDIQTNLFLRRQPGNIATLGDDMGMAVRYSLGF